MSALGKGVKSLDAMVGTHIKLIKLIDNQA
jgi:hypothetical protein